MYGAERPEIQEVNSENTGDSQCCRRIHGDNTANMPVTAEKSEREQNHGVAENTLFTFILDPTEILI